MHIEKYTLSNRFNLKFLNKESAFVSNNKIEITFIYTLKCLHLKKKKIENIFFLISRTSLSKS